MDPRVRRKAPHPAEDALHQSVAELVQAFEKNLGVPGAATVTLSRDRLHNVLHQTARLGAECQQKIHAAQEAQRRAEEEVARMAFPPRQIAEGLFRLRCVAALGSGAWYLWRNARYMGGGCSRPSGAADAFFCLGDGLMGLVFAAAIVCGFAALVLWGAYRVVLWVWRGFRAP
jgi:hypothetical protein